MPKTVTKKKTTKKTTTKTKKKKGENKKVSKEKKKTTYIPQCVKKIKNKQWQQYILRQGLFLMVS